MNAILAVFTHKMTWNCNIFSFVFFSPCVSLIGITRKAQQGKAQDAKLVWSKDLEDANVWDQTGAKQKKFTLRLWHRRKERYLAQSCVCPDWSRLHNDISKWESPKMSNYLHARTQSDNSGQNHGSCEFKLPLVQSRSIAAVRWLQLNGLFSVFQDF